MKEITDQISKQITNPESTFLKDAKSNLAGGEKAFLSPEGNENLKKAGLPETLRPEDAFLESTQIEYFEVNEDQMNKIGGAYKDLPSIEGFEKHHMPADSTSPFSRDDGPCILMEKIDHFQTASWGSSRDAREYRSQQKELIENGKFSEAFLGDVADLQSKFGMKYDKHIQEAQNYLNTIITKGEFS